MSNIRLIKTEQDEYSEQVIDNLKNALKHAEQNPQESVIIVMVGRDSDVNTWWSAVSRLGLIGALEYAKAQASRPD